MLSDSILHMAKLNNGAPTDVCLLLSTLLFICANTVLNDISYSAVATVGPHWPLRHVVLFQTGWISEILTFEMAGNCGDFIIHSTIVTERSHPDLQLESYLSPFINNTSDILRKK